MNRIGIFGGTFNPIHNAHLSIANKFAEQARLDFCYFVPAFISPFKTDNAEELIDASYRVNIVKLAIEDNPIFRICTYEIDKAGISYSYDTLQYLKSKHTDSEFYLLIGMDQAVEFRKWRDWEKILEEAYLYVVPRPENSSDKDIKFVNSLSRDKISWLQTETSDISASSIREAIKNCESISSFVPAKVEDYIIRNGLYNK
jgi:nicotinate-nucleotide adenylyltransferase